ncbi:hypothetical protein [Roseitranquillus sediminis]|uniref:hypothetical protein n=1 Tax=Roseitranquillus sediminis TaxID=2809051 RepID=UPI001D0C990A|nr:hypothetical protein [Roseitranquillus sediminis]MBM9595900.1 hypothetical protein [Roseitranquillus sediminis]
MSGETGARSDAINREFSCNLWYEDNTQLTVSTYDQFFATEEPTHEDPRALEATISYLIGFNREGDQKSYEKQIITLIFISGDTGSARIGVRSTDITWPTGVISLLTSEILKLEKKTTGSNAPKMRLLLAPAAFFRKEILAGITEGKILRLKIAGHVGLILTLSISMIAMLLMIGSVRAPAIYDPATNALITADVVQLVEEHGVDSAVEMLRAGSTLRVAGLSFADGHSPLVGAVLGLIEYAGRVSAVVGLVTFLYCLVCFRHARALDSHYFARILFSGDTPPPRPRVSAKDGVLTSVALGVTGSLFATLIMGLLGFP